ncbi:hypothetical protein LZC95_04345 [Pendulispora brunnea]|uniref:DUF5050 domain-containing protein n=1 Tax=Pendulispora brunnea TaxID=2905690 RepID=A0ABZ2KGL7_9BACT
MRYRHLFLGLLTANAASLLFFYGCDLKSGGDGNGPDPGSDSGIDTGVDAGPGSDCPGVNTQTDKENCGRCNHSCLGSECNAGQCVPKRFVSAPSPVDVALDDAGAAITIGTSPSGRVIYAPFAADGGFLQVVDDTSSPRGAATDGTSVCWANGGRISCRYQDGGTPRSTENDENGPKSTLILGDTVYWINNAPGDVRKFPLDGGTREVVAFGTGTTLNNSLVVDGQRLVWVIGSSKSVVTAPLNGDGGAPTVIATVVVGTPSAVAVGTNDFYYVAVQNTASDLGGIYRVPKTATGGPAELVVRQSLVEPSIAVDGEFVYYTNKTGDGAVYRFNVGDLLPDGGPPAFASGQASPASVRAGTDGFVYWTSNVADGGLMRVAK